MEFTNPDQSASVSNQSSIICNSFITIKTSTTTGQCHNFNHNSSSYNLYSSNLYITSNTSINTSPNTNINGFSNTQYTLHKCKCRNQIEADLSDSLRNRELVNERRKLNLKLTLTELISKKNLTRWLKSLLNNKYKMRRLSKNEKAKNQGFKKFSRIEEINQAMKVNKAKKAFKV
jgi:aryl carrier-like protein